MKKVAIVTSGYLPVPATRGGAVEVLDEYLIKENEKKKYLNLTIFSSDDVEAKKSLKNYKYTSAIFIKTPRYIQVIDKIIFKFVNNILKKTNSNSYRYILQRIYYINKVSKNLSKINYDSLVLENHATLFSVLRKHGNFQRYFGKYYFHMHNEVKNSFRNDKYIQNVTKVLGVSEYINSTLRKKFPSMTSRQFTVVRNAVDSKRFAFDLSLNDKNKIRDNLKLPRNSFVFLYTGRLNKEKGILEAIKAFKKANIENAIFLVVGSAFFDTDIKSNFEIKLKTLIETMDHRVRFTGYIPNEKLGSIYAVADVCVIPSIWEDPAPLTVLEAITAGKAIITTNSGGIPEYVNKKNSIIIDRKVNVICNLERSFKKVYNDKKSIERMEIESKSIRKKLTLGIFYKQFVNSLNPNPK
jgi:glycosyltransferase involved in cell wall biosynthesis